MDITDAMGRVSLSGPLRVDPGANFPRFVRVLSYDHVSLLKVFVFSTSRVLFLGGELNNYNVAIFPTSFLVDLFVKPWGSNHRN